MTWTSTACYAVEEPRLGEPLKNGTGWLGQEPNNPYVFNEYFYNINTGETMRLWMQTRDYVSNGTKGEEERGNNIQYL